MSRFYEFGRRSQLGRLTTSASKNHHNVGVPQRMPLRQKCAYLLVAVKHTVWWDEHSSAQEWFWMIVKPRPSAPVQGNPSSIQLISVVNLAVFRSAELANPKHPRVAAAARYRTTIWLIGFRQTSRRETSPSACFAYVSQTHSDAQAWVTKLF